MAFEMNDLQGILFLVLFAIPLIASTNIDCSGKGFHCVNSTHFMICVDLGNGLSTTIDDFIIPCPATTVCDRNNIFECDFPKVEVTTSSPLQVIGVSKAKKSDTSATTSVSYSEIKTMLPDEILGVFNENVNVTTLSTPEKVTSEKPVNIKQFTRVQSVNTTETNINIQESSSTASTIVIAYDDRASNITNEKTPVTYSNNIYATNPETSIDKIVTTSLTDLTPSIKIDLTTTQRPLDVISTSSQSGTSTNTNSDILDYLYTSYDNTVVMKTRYNIKNVSDNDFKKEVITDKITTPKENTFSKTSFLVDDYNIDSTINTYTQSSSKDVNSIKSNINTLNYTQQNDAGQISATEVSPEIDISYLAPDNIKFTTEPANEVLGSEIYTTSTARIGSSFNMFLSTSQDNNTTATDQNITKKVTNTDEKDENIITTPKGILGEISVIIDDINTTPVVNTDVQSSNNYDINNKVNDDNQNGLINRNFVELYSIGEFVTTEQAPEPDIKHVTPYKTSPILEHLMDRIGSQIITDKKFASLELIDLISNDSHSFADTNSTSSSSPFSSTPYDNLYKNVEQTVDRIKHVMDINLPKVDTTEEIRTAKKVNSHSQNLYNDVINIKSNLNILNASVYQNYTKLNASHTVTTTEHVPENNKNKVDHISQPATLITFPGTTTDKTFTATGVDLISYDSRIEAYNSPPTNVLNNTVIPTVQSMNTDDRYEHVTESIIDTKVTNTLTETFKEDVINMKSNLNIQNASEYQNYTKPNAIHAVTTTEHVSENNKNKIDHISEPATLITFPGTTTDKTFTATGRVDLITYDSQIEAYNSPPINVLNNTVIPIVQSMNTDGRYEHFTDSIMDTNVTNTLTETFKEDVINMKLNLNIQNGSVYQNYTKLNAIHIVTTTEHIPENNKNKIEHISEPATSITFPRMTTENTFTASGRIDLISYNSQVEAYNSPPTNDLNNTVIPTVQSMKTDGRYDHVTDSIIDTEVTNTLTETFKEDVINIKLNLNIQNASVYQNYTKPNATHAVTNTEHVSENKKNIIDHISEPATLMTFPRITTEKTLTFAGHVDFTSYGSQIEAYTSQPSNVLNDSAILTVQSMNTDGRYENVTDSVITTKVTNTLTETFKDDDINMKSNLNIQNASLFQNYTDLNSNGKIATNKHVPVNNTNSIDLISIPVILDIGSETTTEQIVVTSGPGINSYDSQTIAITSPSTNRLLSDLIINKQVKSNYEKNKNETDELITLNENILAESVITNEISTTENINVYTTRFDKNFISNTGLNYINGTNITEKLPDSIKNEVLVSVPEMIVLVPQTTIEKTLITSRHVDLITHKSQSVPNLIPLNDTSILQNASTKQITNTEYENIFGEQYVIADKIDLTPIFQNEVIHNKLNYNNQNLSVTQNFIKQNSIGDITTNKQTPEANTTYTTTDLNVSVSKPEIRVVDHINTNTETTVLTTGLVDIFPNVDQSGTRLNSSFNISTTTNTLSDTTTINKNNTKEIKHNVIFFNVTDKLISPNEKVFKNSVKGDKIRQTIIANTHIPIFHKDGIINETDLKIRNKQVNQHFEETNSKMTSAQVPTNTVKNFTPAPTDFILEAVVIPQTTAKAIVPLTTEENITYSTKTISESNDVPVNESFVKPITTRLLSTDLKIELTDNSYQIYQQPELLFMETKNNTSGTKTSEILESIHYPSSTDTFDDNDPVQTSFLSSPETVRKSNETNINFKSNKVSNINAPPAPRIIIWNAVTNATVKNRTLQSDTLTKVRTDLMREITSPNRSDSDTFVDYDTTKNVTIKDQVERNESILNRLDNTEIFNKTVIDAVEETTIRNNVINIVTALYPLAATDTVSISNSINSIFPAENVANTIIKFQKNKLPQPPLSNQYTPGFIPNITETLYAPPISMDSVQKIQGTDNVATETVPMMNHKIVTSTLLPVDVVNVSNIKSDTNRVLKTIPWQNTFSTTDNTISDIEEMLIMKQTNIVPSNIRNIGYAELNSKNKSIYGSVDTDTAFAKKNKSINVKNNDNTTSYLSVLNTYTDDVSIKIMSKTMATNDTQPNETLKSSNTFETLSDSTEPKSANHNYSNSKIKSKNIETTTNKFNFDSKLTEQLSVPKPLNDLPIATQTIQPEQNLEVTVWSSISPLTSPIKEITTENFKSIRTTEVPIYIRSFSTDHAKVPSVVTETASSTSSLPLSTSATRDGSKKDPVYNEETMNKITKESSTQMTISQLKDTNVYPSEVPPHNSLTLISNQKNNYGITESVLSILGTPSLQNIGTTTEPTRTKYLYSSTIPPPFAKTQNDFLAVTKDLPIDHSISPSNETVLILNSASVPISLVDPITLDRDKINGNHNIGEITNRGVMYNNRTVFNKNANNLIDSKTIVNGTSSKFNTQSKRKNSKNGTENDFFQEEVQVIKIQYPLKDYSIQAESTSKSPVLKRDIDRKNKIFNTTEIVDDDHTSDKTRPINLTEIRSITPQGRTRISDSLGININNSGVRQVGANSGNRPETYNISSTKTNLTLTLSLHNRSFNNNNLEQDLISTNHTITKEMQGNNNNDKSNKTSNELKLSGAGIHNPNLTSTIKVSASLFNCSNHTRGKYADKNDCRKFYICVGKLQPLIGTCPDNTVFSEINKQCTRNLSHCIRNNQFRCLYEGRFSDFFKDNIYYICVKSRINGFVRYKLQCQNGFQLNKFSIKCEKNDDISNQSTSSFSENSKINNDKGNDNSEESKKNISSIQFECKDEGKFPHDYDCRKYYLCTKRKDVYRRKIKTCSSDEVYDKKKKTCVETDSSEC